MQLYILLGIVGLALSVMILRSGWRDSLTRLFPFFYLYVLVSTAGSVALWTSYFLDLQNEGYVHLYFVVHLLRQGLEICILARAYARFRVHDDHRMWQALSLLTGMMAVILLVNWAPNTFRTYQFFTAALLQFQTLFCALTLGHIAMNRRLTIGWNQFTVISGLAISILFKYIGWALVASGAIKFNLLWPWIMPIEIVPWVIWAISMRGKSPTLELPENRLAELEAQRRECEKAVKSLSQR